MKSLSIEKYSGWYDFHMKDAVIRNARPGDESGIHEAHMRSIREVCIKDHGTEEVKGWGYRPLGNRWVDAIKDEKVWVVEKDGAIYGHAYLRFSNENGKPRAYIHGLYLAPEIVHQGFGRK